MFSIFVSAFALGFSGAMMPGPLLTYTVKQSLTSGPKSGFIIIMGHALLEILTIALIFLGLDIVLKSQAVQIAIGLLGGALLIYLGADMVMQAVKNKVSVSVSEGKSAGKSMFFSGMVLTLSNPYFFIWWAIIGLGFIIEAYKTMGYLGVAVYFLGHCFADTLWYTLISTVVGTTRRFIKATLYRIIIACLGGLVIFFGLNFIYDAIKAIV